VGRIDVDAVEISGIVLCEHAIKWRLESKYIHLLLPLWGCRSQVRGNTGGEYYYVVLQLRSPQFVIVDVSR
jgi:hypothetical protein